MPDKKTKKERIDRIAINCALAIGICIVVVVLIAFITTMQQAENNLYGYYDQVKYQTQSEDRKVEYELDRVLQEKGGEPAYRVKLNGEIIEVTEEIWQTYLGEDYSIIPYHTESVTLYYTSQIIFMASEKVGITFTRYSYPWEETAKPFTVQEIQTLATDLHNQWSVGLAPDETTVQYDTQVRTSGFDEFPEGLSTCPAVEFEWWYETLWNALTDGDARKENGKRNIIRNRLF